MRHSHPTRLHRIAPHHRLARRRGGGISKRRSTSSGHVSDGGGGKGSGMALAPGTVRLLSKMERAGPIEDRLIAQRVEMEAKRSRLKLETEALLMADATFTPNLARSPADRKVDVAAMSQRLHAAAVDRSERHRLLQVPPPLPPPLSCAAGPCGRASVPATPQVRRHRVSN